MFLKNKMAYEDDKNMTTSYAIIIAIVRAFRDSKVQRKMLSAFKSVWRSSLTVS